MKTRKKASAKKGHATAMDEEIGRRLRKLRQDAGLSQGALGARVGITFQQMQKYERGVNRVSASRLFMLSRALGVPVIHFYDGLEKVGRGKE